MNLGIRTACVLAVVVGLPVSSYFLVFKPTNKKLESDRTECEQKEKYLTKLHELGNRDADLEKVNEDIRRSVKLIEARLPSSKDLDDLVRQISNLAGESGLKALSIKTAKPVPAGIYMEQPLEIETSGKFVGFFTFIAQVEKLPRITRVHDLKVQGQTKDDTELTAQFTLSIYFQDDKQVAGVAGGKQ